MGLTSIGPVTARPGGAGDRALTLFNIHTKETATITFRRNGAYDQEGLRKLNQFLRDWRQNEPTKMDPALFDLVWEVYQQSGSQKPIHVVSSYRSPKTNGMLRRRSKGVAKNSLHMQGKAMDFYLPDVKLSKLRALGLTFQFGGVGYYPTSGAPFVHMDTGSVRHWPRMSRKELVALFPDGKTVHVPSDGKPLSRYAQAKAETESRKNRQRIVVAGIEPPASWGGRSSAFQVASAAAPQPAARPASDPLVIATSPAQLPPTTTRQVGVAVAAYDTAPAPIPRLAPRRAVAMTAPLAAPLPVLPRVPAAPAPADRIADKIVVASAETGRDGSLAERFDFGQPQDWAAPAVPADLAAAMAARDKTRRNASLPIPPTSVVTTIDISRPLRADAITTAVLRDGGAPTAAPRVLAYAPQQDGVIDIAATGAVHAASANAVPLPRVNPLRHATVNAPTTRSFVPSHQFKLPELTMTTLDTHGLRSWTGRESTRQRTFAVLTMPDIHQVPELIDMPRYSYAAGFSETAYPDLRTDRFAGPLVRQPIIVKLAAR